MKTILVLEDDPSNMQIFCALLCSKGFRVLEATTGQEAIEISTNEIGPIDLLVSDLRLPDLSGTEVALRLIESRPDLPILFLSGIPMLNWTKRDLLNLTCLAASAVDFLENPSTSPHLRRKLKTSCRAMLTSPRFKASAEYYGPLAIFCQATKTRPCINSLGSGCGSSNLGL